APKAKAAGDWLLGAIDEKNLRTPEAGYFPVNGTSHPKPPDNVAWNLGYALEALVRLHEI
ncbi:MAG: hypothetical protein GY851_15285, partial [bacterium]|nr:hypothetical protein [bacterium]